MEIMESNIKLEIKVYICNNTIYINIYILKAILVN